MNQRQSEFPSHQSGLNYAFSDEPILLNGMKVIFDQSTSVYPVNLQHKNGNLFNNSLAKSLSNNTGFSGALSLDSWEDVQNLEIGDNNNNKYLLNADGRLDTLVDKPWKLDQGNEGNCGFAAVIMAMLSLAGTQEEKKGVLKELLNAIYYGNEYKLMKVTKEDGPNKRQAAVPGVIKSRLEKRIKYYYFKSNYDHYISPKYPDDYVLNVGLMLFFKDHLKNNEQPGKRDLWEEIMKFNSIFSVVSEQTKELQQTGSVKKLKDMNNSEKVHPGYKKGDLGLTTEGLLELCKLVGITTKHYRRSPQNLNSQQISDAEKIQILISESTVQRLDTISSSIFSGDSHSQKAWNTMQFPCIVGIYLPEYYKQKPQEIQNFSSYNFLQHWIFMPTKDEVWTWGDKYKLSDKKVKSMVPIEVIECKYMN